MVKFLLKLFIGKIKTAQEISLFVNLFDFRVIHVLDTWFLGFSGIFFTLHRLIWKLGVHFTSYFFLNLICCHSRDMSAPPLISNTTMAFFYIVVNDNTHKMSIFYYIKYKIVNYRVQFDSMKKVFFVPLIWWLPSSLREWCSRPSPARTPLSFVHSNHPSWDTLQQHD